MQTPVSDTQNLAKYSSAPRVSGKSVIAVVPLAVLVTALATGQAWVLAAGVSTAAAAFLCLLLVGIQHISASGCARTETSRGGRPVLVALTVIALGLLTGSVVGFAALVSGFHGNSPIAWLYLCGPVAWGLHFADSDTSYLYSLAVLTPAVWTVYWGFILAGTSRLPRSKLALFVALLHIAFAGGYHVLVGLG
jgi:hypothetical protein